MVRCTWYNIMW